LHRQEKNLFIEKKASLLSDCFSKGGCMVHSIRHWSPRYLWNRGKEKLYRNGHRGEPWLAPEVIRFLETYLKSSDIGLEFGSGGSTVWFAERVKHLTSVEHNQEWYARIKRRLEEKNVTNAVYLFAPKTVGDASGANSDYVKVTETIPAASLDFVLVDGTYRSQCVLRSLPLLKSGGMLIIDNVNKYLPSKSIAPNSRSLAAGAADADWNQVHHLLKSWRYFWSGNGVSDTAIYFKPELEDA
jgi:predicted O-methyltransferase YrrM